jgi:single stranded DNA-binding protein
MEQKNQVEARGTVIRNPDVRETGKGKTFTRFTIAADEVSRDGEKLDPEIHKWHTVLLWGENDINKGDRVRVSGEEVMRQYEDRQGDMRTAAEIHNASVEILERRKAPEIEAPIEAVGNVVKDPELRTTANGKLVARISIAADEVKLNGESIDAQANKWQTAVFWGDKARQLGETVKKGMPVRISGELVARSYTGQDGATKSAVEIHRAFLEVLEKGRGQAGRPAPKGRDAEISR